MRAELPCLPLIRERFVNEIKKHKPKGFNSYIDFEVVNMFVQMWGSTALGFGGVGGSAMTEAYTTIVTDTMGIFGVFFGDGLAYIVENPNQQFRDDIERRHMKSTHDRWVYTTEEDIKEK